MSLRSQTGGTLVTGPDGRPGNASPADLVVAVCRAAMIRPPRLGRPTDRSRTTNSIRNLTSHDWESNKEQIIHAGTAVPRGIHPVGGFRGTAALPELYAAGFPSARRSHSEGHSRPIGKVDQLHLVSAKKLGPRSGIDSVIGQILDRLRIQWTQESIVIGGSTFPANDHVPVLIYPSPLNTTRYVVLNSGHTFHAADFQGTNALLYPRLGDYAVLKPNPTKQDLTATAVVTAGLFDEFWHVDKD
jgi:hypothetical protein